MSYFKGWLGLREKTSALDGVNIQTASDEEKMREKIMEMIVHVKSVVSPRTGHVPVLSPPWWACLADLTEADYHAHQGRILSVPSLPRYRYFSSPFNKCFQFTVKIYLFILRP